MDDIESAFRFDGVPDDAFITRTRGLVGRSNQVLAALIAHLGEVEARGIHRARACASLYTYCIYELRMSEDAAFRRTRAARIARAFPAVIDRLAGGEIHLTGLLMLGPHLTEENHLDVLERAKHRTKKEIARLVRQLDPLPDAPGVVEPLGPPGITIPRAPSWSELVASTVPVRELEPGDRPRDWMGAMDDAPAPGLEGERSREAASARPDEPQRYKVQFTASQEYVDLLERAKDLLSYVGADLERVHLRALQALVADLEKRRFAVGAKPQKASTKHARDPRQRGDTAKSSDSASSRHMPAEVRRVVWERDGGRCTYVDASGQRCRETRLIELHHEVPLRVENHGHGPWYYWRYHGAYGSRGPTDRNSAAKAQPQPHRMTPALRCGAPGSSKPRIATARAQIGALCSSA